MYYYALISLTIEVSKKCHEKEIFSPYNVKFVLKKNSLNNL